MQKQGENHKRKQPSEIRVQERKKKKENHTHFQIANKTEGKGDEGINGTHTQNKQTRK
jgi:hypothetical protein